MGRARHPRPVASGAWDALGSRNEVFFHFASLSGLAWAPGAEFWYRQMGGGAPDIIVPPPAVARSSRAGEKA